MRSKYFALFWRVFDSLSVCLELVEFDKTQTIQAYKQVYIWQAMRPKVHSIKRTWEKLVKKELRTEELFAFLHPSMTRLTLKRVYSRSDVEGLPFTDTTPGAAPFIRGPRATMYSGRPWTIRQYAGFSTAEEFNAFLQKPLEGGAQGVSVAFDLATHRGYDFDHDRVTGDVGKAGVAIDSIDDMKVLFNEILLDKVSVSMTMNGAVLPILACYIVAAKEQGVPLEKLWNNPK